MIDKYVKLGDIIDALEHEWGYEGMREELKKLPTADVVEVVHGEWIEDGDYQVCSVCGEEHHWDEYRATYCEDCGAKMDGKRTNFKDVIDVE